MTEASRRTVLRAAASAVALAPFASALPAFSAAATARLYIRSRFTPLLNKPFKLVGKTGTWSVKLTAVTDLPQATAGAKDSFGLTFSSVSAGPTQGSYILRRSRFTSTTLFVVPSDVDHLTYQAVINNAF